MALRFPCSAEDHDSEVDNSGSLKAIPVLCMTVCSL